MKTKYFLGIIKLIIEHCFKSIEKFAVMRVLVKTLKKLSKALLNQRFI